MKSKLATNMEEVEAKKKTHSISIDKKGNNKQIFRISKNAKVKTGGASKTRRITIEMVLEKIDIIIENKMTIIKVHKKISETFNSMDATKSGKKNTFTKIRMNLLTKIRGISSQRKENKVRILTKI